MFSVILTNIPLSLSLYLSIFLFLSLHAYIYICVRVCVCAACVGVCMCLHSYVSYLTLFLCVGEGLRVSDYILHIFMYICRCLSCTGVCEKTVQVLTHHFWKSKIVSLWLIQNRDKINKALYSRFHTSYHFILTAFKIRVTLGTLWDKSSFVNIVLIHR